MATNQLGLMITKKQDAFRTSSAFETLYGGAAGGGKSHGQLVDALLYALVYPKSSQIIFRRSFGELERSLIKKHLEFYPAGLYKYNASKHEGRFMNGSTITFAHMERENSVYGHQSAEYDVVRFDELTHFSKDQYIYMISRVRGTRPYPRAIKSSTNPGGVGHSWVKARFIDPSPPGQLFEAPVNEDEPGGIKTSRIFIPASVYDNPWIIRNDPKYITNLLMQDEETRRALLYGDWNLTKGRYFTEFKEAIHVIRPFEIPPDWRIYRAIDYGLDMLACYWIATDFQGRAYVIRELYKSGLIVSDAAAAIKAMTPPGEQVRATMAPGDMWNRHSDTGRSTAEIFGKAGIPLTRAKNERVQGWYDLKEWLRPFEDEQGQKIAGLRIFESCRELIRTLPALQTDDRDPNDAAREPHELTHAPDAIRYFVAGRPTPAKAAPKRPDRSESAMRALLDY
ncbi:MAG: phage terminase large subunit [Christensenellaceae bacterium]|jgi:hypothetical protein|nr:phage terminase large subunit [Christensenellaceae bacterium]